MAKRNFSSTDLWEFLNYSWPYVGRQALTTSGTAGAGVFDNIVAYTDIKATDVVTCQLQSCATINCYIKWVTITAGTGFTVYTNESSPGSLCYVVHRNNS